MFAPIDIKQALLYVQSSTPSLCVRADSSSWWQKKALNSHQLRDRHIYASQMQDTRYIHTRYTHACGVCGLFCWSMAAGLLAFSSRQFAARGAKRLYFTTVVGAVSPNRHNRDTAQQYAQVCLVSIYMMFGVIPLVHIAPSLTRSLHHLLLRGRANWLVLNFSALQLSSLV